MSENGPPRLRKAGTDNEKEEDSRKFKKPDTTHLREKISSLNIKKPKTNIKSKVSSFKSKNKENTPTNKGPLKVRTPSTETSTPTVSDKVKDLTQIMRKRPILSILGIIILIILVVSVAIWAVSDKPVMVPNNTTNHTNIQKFHFDNGDVAFDFPEGWNVTNNTTSSTSQSKLIATVTKDENNSLTIFKESLGTQNFTYRVASWRSNILQKGMIYYEGDLNIDNTTAYELEANYKPNDKVFTTRGIAFQKNNTAYFLIFVFDHPLLDYKNEMDKIINSFHVIEKNQTKF